MSALCYTVNDIKNIIQYANDKYYTLSIASAMNADKVVLTSLHANHIQIINKMNKIIEINTDKNYVIVEAGITWILLLEELDKIGYTLYTTQSGLIFSVGGSFCGNAHGRKTEIPMVKDSILEFSFIDGQGEAHTVDTRSDVFNAFPGSLGLLGIITTMKLKIKKRYNVCANHRIIPYSKESIDYIYTLTQDPNVCMLNIQVSYFPNIKEIIVVDHRYNNLPVLDEYDKTLYIKDSRMYYTCCILLLVILSIFSFFDSIRWNLEKYASKTAINTHSCININNSFDNWSRPYYPNFKIIEFFFPKNDYMYCQATMMKLFTKHGMTPLSSGTRIIYERTPSNGFIRFSHASSREIPYYSLVINYIENSNIYSLITDIRNSIIKQNIHMTYHTTYNFLFTQEDLKFMFPGIQAFRELKKLYDPNGVFTNEFNERYLSF